MSRDLRDKVIVITGASSGIGAATAIACAKAGMRVALAARREDQLRQVAGQIARWGGHAQPIVCDVTRDDEVTALFERSWDVMGRLDAVFANAGYGMIRPVLDTSDEQIRAIFETNFFGTIRCLRAAMPTLRQTPSGLRHLLICSSAASEIAPPRHGIYAATKAAQDSIAGAMRAELAPENIHVTSVHPVGTRTAFFDALVASPDRRGIANATNTPEWFVQTPEQVARAVVKALKRPRPEVWPQPIARFGLAMTTAFPRLAARVMRRR